MIFVKPSLFNIKRAVQWCVQNYA